MRDTTIDRVMVGQTCPICNGNGKMQGDPLTGDNDPMFPAFPCTHCHGTGVINQQWIPLNQFVRVFWKEMEKMGMIRR